MGTIDALNIELTAELAVQKDELRKTGKVIPGLLVKIVELLSTEMFKILDEPETEFWEDAWACRTLKDCEPALTAGMEYKKGRMSGRVFLVQVEKLLKTLNERPF